MNFKAVRPCQTSEKDNEPCLTCEYLNVCNLGDDEQ